MISRKSKLHCIYCSTPSKRGRKGEHIIPRAIGGGRTLNEVPNRVVCSKCNSGVLSQLDKELCSRSYLSAIASQEIDAHLWQVWDVDHASEQLLIEARPLWGRDNTLNALVCYPQITFERTGAEVRGDYDECCNFGREDFTKVLFKAVTNCFGRFRAGEKGALHLERIRSGVIHDRYRLAPRVFTSHTISDIARNIKQQSFILRFHSDEEKRFALNALSTLNDGRQLKKWTYKPGSHTPTICFSFDIRDTMRALMKLGVNLIAAYCPNTPVDRKSSSSAIQIVRDGLQVPPHVLEANGFVHARDIQVIKAAGNAHSFRLVHDDQKWHVFSSFFGGRIGAYVRVPGPNHESWRCADIVAPLESKAWTFTSTSIFPYMKKVHIAWKDTNLVAPSLKLHNSVSSVSVEFSKKVPVS